MLTGRRGFTLVELMISLVILTLAVFGIAASAGRLGGAAGEAEVKALAVQAAEDRLNLVVLDPQYDSIASRYLGTESTVLGLPGATRETLIQRYRLLQAGGGVLDYTRITVKVAGAGLAVPVVRETVVGAP